MKSISTLCYCTQSFQEKGLFQKPFLILLVASSSCLGSTLFWLSGLLTILDPGNSYFNITSPTTVLFCLHLVSHQLCPVPTLFFFSQFYSWNAESAELSLSQLFL